jgi:hypothetical protein
MTQLTIETNIPTIWKPQTITPIDAGKVVCAFLDTATTSFGRATHYNTRDEQQTAELDAHQALMNMERDLYTAMLMLPGVTDRSVQLGMKSLLSTPRNGVEGFLTPEQEREALYWMIASLPPQRMLKLIDAFKLGSEELGIRKANNARTRKLILRTLLTSKRLQLWAVKYRRRMRKALTHAWGQRVASIMRSILARDPAVWTEKERQIVHSNLDRYLDSSQSQQNGKLSPRDYSRQCVSFVLGNRKDMTLPLLVAFTAARDDLHAGKKLPFEVLDGIRSTYHGAVPSADLLELVKETLSTGQRKAVQKRAKAVGVEVAMDPLKYSPIELYLYAFEMGMTEEIEAALVAKAERSASGFPAKYSKIGILVDASMSMAGSKEQPLRPMATTLALRDMLSATADSAHVLFSGGALEGALVRPRGDTGLAENLLDLISTDPVPDAVFVLSDGYENTPAGRFAEVVVALRDAHIDIPIYHFNPVFAAESVGVRELAKDVVPTVPVQNPAALGTTFLRGLIDTDPIRGINALIQAARIPLLTTPKKSA